MSFRTAEESVQPSRLLALPYEIRAQIIHESFYPGTEIVMVEAEDGHIHPQSRIAAQLLSVNKQLYHESQGQLPLIVRTVDRFVLDLEATSALEFLQNLPANILKCISKLWLTGRISNSISIQRGYKQMDYMYTRINDEEWDPWFWKRVDVFNFDGRSQERVVQYIEEELFNFMRSWMNLEELALSLDCSFFAICDSNLPLIVKGMLRMGNVDRLILFSGFPRDLVNCGEDRDSFDCLVIRFMTRFFFQVSLNVAEHPSGETLDLEYVMRNNDHQFEDALAEDTQALVKLWQYPQSCQSITVITVPSK